MNVSKTNIYRVDIQLEYFTLNYSLGGGKILIGSHAGKVFKVDFMDAELDCYDLVWEGKIAARIFWAKDEVNFFISGPIKLQLVHGGKINDWAEFVSRYKFEDFNLAGKTQFTRKIYEELFKVKCGEILSYTELAARSGNVKAVRAVGRAMATNPIPFFIPCHRVIGKNGGGLTGYAYGVDLKRDLLKREGVNL